jgi:predicted TIM-barrel fold metal-dependent hydrolase
MGDRIVDSHAHAWTAPRDIDWEGSGPSGATELVYTVDDVRDDAARLEADRTCLVATPIHGTGSPYTRRVLEENPGEFYGVLWLDYFADDVGEQVDDALAIEDVIGFRFYATGDGDWIASPDLDPFWTALERHDAPQVQLLLDPETFPALETLVGEHPDVTFVVDHIGQPSPGDRAPDERPYAKMAALAEHPNVYVKVTHTSSEEVFPFADIHPHVRSLLDWFGSERLLWGSDFIYHFKEATPWETRHFLEEIDVLSAGDRRDLLSRTFESTLG